MIKKFIKKLIERKKEMNSSKKIFKKTGVDLNEVLKMQEELEVNNL